MKEPGELLLLGRNEGRVKTSARPCMNHTKKKQGCACGSARFKAFQLAKVRVP